jgi:deazaflavin-dependent oxidoreductase (nitroreductase family)
MAEQERFKKPGWWTKHVFNPAVAGLTRLGISLAGSRVLEVTGRTSGEPRRTPVNLLKFDGGEYLVAPRGQTQWVKNVRANPRARLLVGRRDKDVTLSELPPAETVPLLRAYLKQWKWEVGQFFGGTGPESSDEELARIAPDHPVFRVDSAA